MVLIIARPFNKAIQYSHMLSIVESGRIYRTKGVPAQDRDDAGGLLPMDEERTRG